MLFQEALSKKPLVSIYTEERKSLGGNLCTQRFWIIEATSENMEMADGEVKNTCSFSIPLISTHSQNCTCGKSKTCSLMDKQVIFRKNANIWYWQEYENTS